MAYSNPTPYPSVTTILRPYIVTDFFTEESRQRGTAIHSAVAAHLRGEYVIPMPAEWRGYFNSFRRWCDQMQPECVLIEERLIDRQLGYCGQPDIIGTIQGRKGIGLIDLKTGVAAEKSWPLQVAGYRKLAVVDRGITTAWGATLRLRPDGKMPIFNEWPDYAHDWNAFQACLVAYKYFN